jgi:hypothetical protein
VACRQVDRSGSNADRIEPSAQEDASAALPQTPIDRLVEVDVKLIDLVVADPIDLT